MSGRSRDPWVKWFPGDFLHGVSDLEANEIAVYVIVLNLIYDKQAPWPYDAKRLARRCRLRQNVVEEVVESLIDYGKLALVEGALTNEKAEQLIGKRQEESGKRSDAAKTRWQDKTGKGSEIIGGADANAVHAASKRDANQKLEARDQKPDKEAPEAPEPPGGGDLFGDGDASKVKSETPVEEAFRLYNELALRVRGSVAEALTDKRKSALGARLNGRGVEGWKEALKLVEHSKFLCGEVPGRDGKPPFKLNLDMLLRPDNFQRLREGYYGNDREPEGAREGETPEGWSTTRWARIRTIYESTGAWPVEAGPKPGEPGCKAPFAGDDYVNQ